VRAAQARKRKQEETVDITHEELMAYVIMSNSLALSYSVVV